MLRTIAVLLLLIASIGLVFQLVSQSNRGTKSAVEELGKLPKTEAEFRTEIAKLRMQREKLTDAIRALEVERQKSVQQLTANGVKSVADVKGKKELEFTLKALQSTTRKLQKIKDDIAGYDEAIASIQAVLNNLRTEQIGSAAALSEEDWRHVKTIVADAEERLDLNTTNDLFEDEELDELIQVEVTGVKSAEEESRQGEGVDNKKQELLDLLKED